MSVLNDFMQEMRVFLDTRHWEECRGPQAMREMNTLLMIDNDFERKDDRIDRLETALQDIESWSRAYPLDIFPEPDFKRAHELLQAGGMTIDSISASNMRHCVERVGKIARDALKL